MSYQDNMNPPTTTRECPCARKCTCHIDRHAISMAKSSVNHFRATPSSKERVSQRNFSRALSRFMDILSVKPKRCRSSCVLRFLQRHSHRSTKKFGLRSPPHAKHPCDASSNPSHRRLTRGAAHAIRTQPRLSTLHYGGGAGRAAQVTVLCRDDRLGMGPWMAP